MTKAWQTHAVCLLVIVLVCAAVFWPVVSGRATLVPTDILHQLTLPLGASVTTPHLKNHYYMDVVTEVYPTYCYFQRCFRSGQWPIWNPYIWCGSPTYALSTYSFACPFNAVYWLLPMPAAYHWSIVLQFMTAGVFMYALLRHWRLGYLACLLGALAYALNTEFIFLYWHATLRAFVWTPLVILFFDLAVQGDWIRHSLVAGLFAGVAIVSGSIQTAAFVLLLLGMYAVALAIVRRRELKVARIVAVTAVVTLIAVLVAAVQLLPTLELLRLDVTGQVAAGHTTGRTTSFLDGLKLIPFLSTFVVPSLWGSTETFDLLKVVHATAGNFQGYVGAASFVLIVLAIATWREPQVKILALCAAFVVGLLILAPFARRYLYYRFLVAYAFAAAGLAAFGLDRLLNHTDEEPADGRVRKSLWALSIFLGLATLGVLAIQTAYALRREPLTTLSKRVIMQRTQETAFSTETTWLEERVDGFWQHYRLTNPAFGVPLAAGGLAIVAALARLRGDCRRWCGPAFVGLVVLDLMLLAVRLMPMIDLKTYPLYPATALTDLLQQSATRVYRWPTTGRRILQDDLLMAYGISSFGGYGSLFPLTMERVLGNAGRITNAAALGMCGVTHLLAKTNEAPDDPAFELVSEDVVRVYRNTAALPRARFVDHYVNVASLSECETLMTRPNWQPQSVPIIETDRQPATQTHAQIEEAQARILSEKITELEIAVHNERPGYLLLADTFYPGWQAFVDGRPTTIHRANGAQRAVFVEAGEHQVRFHYAPASLRMGAMISGATLVLCLAMWLMRPRRRQTSSSTSA